jgi:hypothetical protein
VTLKLMQNSSFPTIVATDDGDYGSNIAVWEQNSKYTFV